MYIRVDTSEVRDLAGDIRRNADEFTGRVQLVMDKVGFDVQAMAQVLCPVDTGNLKSSISIDHGPLSFDVGPTASYGDYVERGVPHPWVITASPGSSLHFWIDGREVFAKRVVHPPMAPQPYLAPAFDVGLQRAEEGLADLAEQVLR